jgi:uncharacterized protein (TIGR02145 family)
MYQRIILLILFPLFGFSQAPQKINFQSILRNTNGEVVANKLVSLKISILSGSIGGSAAYSETHTKTTDPSGLISLQIGNGTVLSGVFANIAWGDFPHFIKLEADFSGGSNYIVLGTQELMSVPYALYASKTDTSSLNLVNRFNSKVNVSDTISLSNRIDTKSSLSDTSLLNLTNRFSSKVNISDTSNMLANYRNGLNAKAPINNPTFTGTVSGIDKNMVGLGNVDNVSDANKPISTATQTALNNKVNISDTSDMLSNYKAGLNSKVNISDTSDMLNPYLRKADAIGSVEADPVFNTSVAKGINGIDTAYWNRKVNISDTSNMLANYRTGLNEKVNIADTSNMLSNYRTGLNQKVNVSDTSDMLNPYLRKADAIGSVETDPVFNSSVAKGITGIDTAYWNRKVNISDTSSMLTNYRTGLNKKVNIADTSNMLSNYRTGLNQKVNVSDTSDMLANYRTGLNAKAPINNPTFTGTVSGIDKNMVGLGNVDNVSDANKPISTATQTALNTKLNISDFPLGTTPGNIQYWNGTTWVNLAPGLPGQVISMASTGIPSWSGAAYPTLTTSSISSITSTSVYGGGNISSDGGAAVSARGLVYATTSNPTLSNSLLTIGSGTGSFSGTISGLTPNTTYYVRAYATNSAGTGYGNEISFQTLPIEVPTLVTTDASGITQTTVTSGGTISNDGGATITERGIVYGTSTDPTTSNTKVTSGSGTGSFSVNVSNLTAITTYYIRSYAINSAGTGYGNNITFQTAIPAVPSLTTRELLNITNTTATGGGSITNDGGSNITSKGICWGISPNPTTADSKTTDGTGTTTFTSFITGLSANVTYFVRAYATNSTGTGYGNQQAFTSSSTSNTLPFVTSTSVTGLTTVQATINAEVNSQGGGIVTERGAVWNTGGNPTVNSNRVPSGAGTGVYTATLTGLSAGSNYYVRAYAINNFGISYGVDIPFTTLFGLATLTTNNAITQSTTASSGGNITDNGGSTITVRGVVWNTAGTPTISDSKTTDGSGTGSYLSNMMLLSPSTIYYVRAYATNSTGTSYGNEVTLTTSAPFSCGTFTVSDIDGNSYNTIGIGNQCWMSENLKTSRYRNGGSIPYVVGNTDWASLTTGAWSYYDHNVENNLVYGKLYNWFTVKGDTLCPTGWHLPSDDDWNILTSNLGGSGLAGGKMKSIGSTYWNDPNTGATNESGFSALPGGVRNNGGGFENIRNNAFFWSAQYGGIYASSRRVSISNSSIERESYYLADSRLMSGASIRCLKD